jgi:hypothetical protein
MEAGEDIICTNLTYSTIPWNSRIDVNINYSTPYKKSFPFENMANL